jgi:hypothetical protein
MEHDDNTGLLDMERTWNKRGNNWEHMEQGPGLALVGPGAAPRIVASIYVQPD